MAEHDSTGRAFAAKPDPDRMRRLLRLVLPLADRLVRFGLTGLLSLTACVGLTVVFHEWWGWAEELAFAAALALTYVANFLSCKYLVFVGGEGRAGRQLMTYGLASLVFRGLEFLGFVVLHTWLGVPYVIAAIAVKVIAFGVKFIFYGWVVFKDPVLRRFGQRPGVDEQPPS